MEEPKSINLRHLEFSPTVNPLITLDEMVIHRRHVSTGLSSDLIDPATGEVVGANVIRTIEEKDDAEFVKVFSAGIAAAFCLSRTAHRVFQLVLQQYERAPMHGGYADSVYLYVSAGCINGEPMDMSEKTYNRGLKELLNKGFLAPRTPFVFWTNAALFFKGSRVLFVREYRRKASLPSEKKQKTIEHDEQ